MSGMSFSGFRDILDLEIRSSAIACSAEESKMLASQQEI